MKTGFTCSAFDLLHAGHLMMLEECKSQCDYLIAGLHVDPTIERPEKNKPVETVEERILRLRGCRYVDEVVIYNTEEDLLNILKGYKPDVRFIGSDWKDKKITGDDLDIRIVYNTRDHEFSSSNLRTRICNQK